MRSNRKGSLIFIRHGESIWNVTDPKRGLTARFTGWVDVPLTDKGREQAQAVGRCLKMHNIQYDAVYTSLLSRSKETFDLAHDTTNYKKDMPIINSWRLNERHYGALVGLSKEEAGKKMGEEKVMMWRKSWDARPPRMNEEDIFHWNASKWAKPLTIVNKNGQQLYRYTERNMNVPYTESLEDCAGRIPPLWQSSILP